MKKARIFGWLAGLAAVAGALHTGWKALALYADRWQTSAPWTVALLWPGCLYLAAVAGLTLLFFYFSRPQK